MVRMIAMALGAALVASPAMASDIFGNGSTKDAPAGVSTSSPVTWTGLYIGGGIGYGNANHNLTVQDYFKDYCDGRGDTTVGFEGGDDVEDTLANLNKGKASTEDYFRTSCETYKKTEGNPPVAKPTGDVTIPGDSRNIAELDGLNSHGIVGDARIGFDIARGRFLFGIFGSYGLNAMETDGSIAGVGSFSLEKGDEWSIGGRAGIIAGNRTLLYILAAYTATEYDLSVRGGNGFSYDKTTDFDGVTVGGGIEYALTSNVFLGLEYQHTFYGDEKILDIYDAKSNQGLRVIDDLDEDKVMATLKIKLNAFGGSGL